MNITAMGRLNRLLTYMSLIKTLNLTNINEHKTNKHEHLFS